MTDTRNGKLRICALLIAATIAISGCKLMHDEVSADAAPGPQSTDTRSLVVDWAAPTAYDDGSPLMDLSGYKVYYGRSPGVYDNRIEIDQIGISTYVIDVGEPGTYYIAMSSINSAGVESVLSSEVSRTVL